MKPSEISVAEYLSELAILLPGVLQYTPWQIVSELPDLIARILPTLDDSYQIRNGIALHKTALLEEGVVLKPPVILGEGCRIGAHVVLRGGVLATREVTLGPGCEIKCSMLFSGASLAHFNFVGDSLIGSRVNFEAGAITANHYNEREEKQIYVALNGRCLPTGVTKFGTLAGDGSKIGANAVLSPGTLLRPGSVVGRLQLIDQTTDLTRHSGNSGLER
ncbi:MAG: hypothetical protein LWW85_09300 [Marinilabiliales bacterium]|nr:hypothetical protein [Marinilabiliales bacterium]